MKYQYKVIIVNSREEMSIKRLSEYLSDDWEVFLATPECVTRGEGLNTHHGDVYFTIRKEKE